MEIAGHLCRISSKLWARTTTTWIQLNTSRRHGRPRKDWRDEVDAHEILAYGDVKSQGVDAQRGGLCLAWGHYEVKNENEINFNNVLFTYESIRTNQ